MTARVRLDMREFNEDFRRLKMVDYPRAFANGLDMVTEGLQRFERMNAFQQFKLHTDWVPNQIMRFPGTLIQRRIIEKMILQKREAFASVFSSKHIYWMAMHEDGGERIPHSYGAVGDSGKKLAVPVNNLGRSMKTSTGATRLRYKPGELLRNSTNPWVKGSSHPGERGNGTKKPFILRSNGKSFIAQRVRGGKGKLAIYYSFQNSAKIKQTWKFESRGVAWAEMHASRRMTQSLAAFTRKYG